MELLLIYFWLKLNAIITLSVICTAALGLVLFITFLYVIDGNKYSTVQHRKKTVTGFIFFLLLSIAIPSRTEVAILVGASYAFKVAETPEAEKAMKLIRAKANELMDEEINKITKEKK